MGRKRSMRCAIGGLLGMEEFNGRKGFTGRFAGTAKASIVRT